MAEKPHRRETPADGDPVRRLFFGLCRILLRSSDPYLVTASLAKALCLDAPEIARELDELLYDLATVARLEGSFWPEAEAAELRRELEVLRRMPRHLKLDLLLSPSTREHCGRQAIPLLAVALFQAWSRLDVGEEWLRFMEPLRAHVDARLARLAEPARLGDSSKERTLK